MPRLFIFFCLCLPLCAQPAPGRSEKLDNQAILTMVKAGLSDEVVLAKIRSTPSSFDVSAQALADLKKNGVSERVIMVMLETANPGLRQTGRAPASPAATARGRSVEPLAQPAPQTASRQEPRSTPPPYVRRPSRYDDEETDRAIVFGGLAYSRGDLDANFFGWGAALTGMLTDRLGVKADFSGVYTSVENEVDYSLYSFAFGPEFRGGSDTVHYFAHVLVGLSRTGAGLNFLNASDNNIEYIFGGGLDLWLTESFGVRPFQGDFQLIRAGGHSINQARISAGAVFRF